MKHTLKTTVLAMLCLFLIFSMCPPSSVSATDSSAQEISNIGIVTAHSGFPDISILFDNNYSLGWLAEEVASLTLYHESGMGSLYLTFGQAPSVYTLRNDDTGICYTAGEYGYLHDFIDLVEAFGTAPKSITIFFESGGIRLNELDVFSPGQVPDSIQKWETAPDGKVDLLLFATHGDDDQTFFAGLLPYYAVGKGYEVQVVYLTDHRNTSPVPVHEMLNGLWACGIRNYPVFGYFWELQTVYGINDAFSQYRSLGWSRDEMTGFIVEQLRRFRPLVAVGHDLNGEYEEPQHMVCAQLLTDAVNLSADESKFPESAEAYGVWDVPKTYLHLYYKNQITLDLDQPMENFGGMTPFEVSKKLGFPAHESLQRHWSWFFSSFDTAAQIVYYSPCKYGLYRTTVGDDVQKNDMFENLISHAEQTRIEEEAKLEAERQQAEEQARIEAEEQARREAEEASIAAEEAARQAEEAARQAELEARQKEAARLAEQERLRAEEETRQKEAQQQKLIFSILGIVAVIALIAIVSALYRKMTGGKFSKFHRAKK